MTENEDNQDNQDNQDAATPPPVPAPPSPLPPMENISKSPPPRVALGADGAVSMPAPAQSVPFWQKIPKRFLIGGGVVLVILIVTWFAGRGKTDATDLQAGDCFEEPSGNDIRDVKDQPCDGLHEVEILVVTSLASGTPWPGLNPFAPGDTPASEACFNAIDPSLINLDNVPADTLEGHFFPDQSAWNGGDRKILCYAQSGIGFPGPVMIRE